MAPKAFRADTSADVPVAATASGASFPSNCIVPAKVA